MNTHGQSALSLSDLPLPAWICDAATGRILSANNVAARFYGYDDSEFAQLKLTDLEANPCSGSPAGSGSTGVSCDCANVTHRTRAGARFSTSLRVSDILHEGHRAKLMLSQSADFASAACPSDVETASQLSLPGPQSSVIHRITNRVARLGTWVIAAEKDYVLWSAECAELHGLDRHKKTLTRAEALAFAVVKAQADAIARDVAHCMTDGTPFDRFITIETATKDIRSVRAIGEARLGANGKVVAVVGAVADVTEIVALESQAVTVSKRLELTLNRMNQAYFLVDAECRLVHVNQEFAQLMAISPERLQGQLLWDVLPSGRGTDLEHALEKVIQTGKPANYSGLAGNAGVWIKARAFAAEDGAAVFFHDASEEQSVVQQLDLLESAAANTNDMIIVTEPIPQGSDYIPKILYVNNAFERATGFTRDEAIGSTMRILQGPQTNEHSIARLRKSLAVKQSIRIELTLQKKNGEPFWVEADIVPSLDADGECKHIIFTQRDVSDRKRAEEKLRVSEERFELLSRATRDFVRDWKISDDSLWWNDAASSGLSLDQNADHSSRSWEQRIHEEDRDRVLSHLRDFLAGSETLWEDEYRLLTDDGKERELVDRGILVRDDDGTPLRMLNSMLDVTERNATNAQLRQSQKLQAVGELTGGLAHDLNNTLTIVIGNAELLSERLQGCNLESERALADLIVNASERSAEMMSRLLKVARKHPLEPSPVNLSEELGEMELLLRKTLSEDYEIMIKPSQELWLTDVDLSQFQSALINLLANGRDAMPNGGSIVIETRNHRLTKEQVRGEADLEPGDFVKISVSDTGHGMSAEVRDRVFEPFFTTKPGDAGNGLGLSMIYGFMKQSGGHVTIYSEKDNGTTVNLYFPRSGKTMTDTEDTPGNTDFGASAGSHVLVVEDHDLVREHVVEIVKDLGFTVSMAASGSEALEVLAQDESISLLFTDVVMPGGMNGPQLAEIARQRYPSLRVLYTSGYIADALAADGRMPDHSELITKPYRREELARMFFKVLRGVEQ